MADDSIKRILVVKLADIGDLLLTTPALSALRESYPNAQIDMLTTGHAAPILNGTGLVDRVILFDKFAFDRVTDLLKPMNWINGLRLAWELRGGHYDAVLIFSHLTTRFGAIKYALLALTSGAPIRAGLENGRGWFLTHRAPDHGFGRRHEVRYWLDVARLLNVTIKDVRLHVGISAADREWAAQHLPADAPLAAIHPGSGGYSPARRWEPQKFAQVADALHETHGFTVLLVGGPRDDVESVLASMQHQPLNLAGQTTLGQLAAVLERCALYVGADSGLMHMAAASMPHSASLISLFGPSNHRAWQAWGLKESVGPDIHILRSGVLCSPCSYVGHTVGLRQGCAARTCMKLIQPQDVLLTMGTLSQPEPDVPRQRDTLHVLGVPVDALTFADLLDYLAEWIQTSSPHQIGTVNPEFIMMAQQDVNFFNILQRCDLCIPDGVGLLWAARQLGHALPERVTGSDGVPLIAERAAREGWRLFLLGAAQGVAEKTARILLERYPGLKIVGTYAGSPAAQEEDEIVAMVAASGADILFVAYGAPAQDKWIARNLPRLNVKVAMGVGGAFDFIAGVTQRAPVWMRRLGIEWLHRLLRQPWRLRRMMRLPRFVVAVLRRGSQGPRAFVEGTTRQE